MEVTEICCYIPSLKRIFGLNVEYKFVNLLISRKICAITNPCALKQMTDETEDRLGAIFNAERSISSTAENEVLVV